MQIDILTLFPQMFASVFEESILGRAQKKKLLEINLYNIRDFTHDKHKTVDDKPYGGGVGMVMKVDVLAEAIEAIKDKREKIKEKPYIILLSAQGKLFKQKLAQKVAKKKWLILVCGHYEGVDGRIRHFIDEEISIGDYVLTGGEIPAMAIVDSVTRLLPGVLVKEEAVQFESFSLPTSNFPHLTLEYPQYTRPEIFRDLKVPKILLSGNHAQIAAWRVKEALKLTKKVRPDLLKEGGKNE